MSVTIHHEMEDNTPIKSARVAMREALRKSRHAHLVSVMALDDNNSLTISRTNVRSDTNSHGEITLVGKAIARHVGVDETPIKVLVDLLDEMLDGSHLPLDKGTYICIGKMPSPSEDGTCLFMVSDPMRFPEMAPPNVSVLSP